MGAPDLRQRRPAHSHAQGHGIRFNENDARPLGRTARGVKAIELREGDEVVGMEVLDDAKAVLTVSTPATADAANLRITDSSREAARAR